MALDAHVLDGARVWRKILAAMRSRLCATVAAATLAVLAPGAARPQAQRAAATFRLIVEAPTRTRVDFERAAKDGFRCAAVARPVPPLLPNNVVVLLTKPAGSSGPAPAMTVVTARAAALDTFQDALNKVAATGFRVCGVTVTQPEFDRSNIATLVAVLSKVDGPPPEYLVLRTRLQPGQWEPLERSAAAGFLVSQVMPRPQASVAETGEMLLLAEKTADTPPSAYTLVFADMAQALESALAGRATQGYRLQGVWAAGARLNALMARPLTGAWPGTRDYRVDERAQLRLSAIDGEFVGLVRRGGGVVTVYDQARRSESTLTSGEILDVARRPVLEPRIETRLLEKLDSDGGRGYQPFEFTLRPGPRDQALVDVVLLRPPAP